MRTYPSKAELVGDLDIPAATGRVYLLRDKHVSSHGEAYETLHVMSAAAGGQVRGYIRLVDSPTWRITRPNYAGLWPEVDRAVAALTGDIVSSEEMFTP